jgi:hypothetical protein
MMTNELVPKRGRTEQVGEAGDRLEVVDGEGATAAFVHFLVVEDP